MLGYERLFDVDRKRWIGALMIGAGLVLMATLRIVVVVYVLALMGAVAWHAAARLLPERPWRTIAAGAFSSLAVMAAGAFAAFAAPTLVGEIDARVIRTRLSGGDEQVIMSLLRNAWRIISETIFGISPGLSLSF